MNSSFLLVIHFALSFYTLAIFLKSLFQFGLSNIYRKFFNYFLNLLLALYFGLFFVADLGFFIRNSLFKLQHLLIIMGSVSFMIQSLSYIHRTSKIKSRTLVRLPLLGGLLVWTFFLDHIVMIKDITLVLFFLYTTWLITKQALSRYLKRALFKMCFFSLLSFLSSQVYFLKEAYFHFILLFPALFYFYLYQHVLGISQLIDEKNQGS